MHQVILHIGSNIGNRRKYLSVCKQLISERIGVINSSSSIYETEAWGNVDQGSFLNQAFNISTQLKALEVLTKCQQIEHLLNRERSIKWGPRTMDIDIIFYDDLQVQSNELQLPHPRMHERNFVLFPLNEIAPDWKHPILGKSVKQLKTESQDTSYVSV